MIKFRIAAVTIMVVGITAQASAREAVVAPSAPQAKATPSAEHRYCIVDQVTGSRLPVKECRTRKEWLDLGVDPLAKN